MSITEDVVGLVKRNWYFLETKD